MAEAQSTARANFLQALARLHERFLHGVDGVTELWLIRHGDAYTELVSPDDLAAPVAPEPDSGLRIDPPLSARGRAEAARLGKRLRSAGVTSIWSSQIRRARETAEIAAAPLGFAVRTDDRLREVKTRWEDMPPPSTDPSIDNEPGGGYIPFVEPIDEVVARMDGFARDVVALSGPGARVAAITHAGAISFYLAHLLRLDSGPLRVLPLFTSVSVLLFKDDRVVVQSIGDVGHLAQKDGAGD